MTIINVFRSANGFTILADGHCHAPRTDDDRDLVCCAVSTLLHALACSCSNIDGVCTVYHTKPNGGYVELTVTNSIVDPVGVQARLQLVLDGLETLGQQYPQCLRVSITG